jgi:ribosomal protein S18 acetylase RimI-like enzyme
MQILPANVLDLNALRHIEQACFPKDAWPILDLFAVLTFPGVIRLKAVEGDQMIGFVAGDPRPMEGFSWIATIGVLPEYQGKGFGRALLEACEAQLTTKRIRLSVRPSNEHAICIYEKSGYKLVDRWTRYYDDGEDALIMEKSRN